MKYSTTLLLLALIALTTFVFVARASDDEDDFVDEEDDGIKYSKNIITLTDDNFEDEIKKHEHILVEFYANWCPHCKNLAPEISKAADILADEGSDIKIATIECDKNNKKCTEFNIPGFPSMIYFRNHERSADFEEGRDAQSIVKYLKRKSGPPAIALADQAAVDAFVAEQKTSEVSAVVGSFKTKDSDLYKAFLKVATENDEFVFGEVVGAEEESIKVYQYFSEEAKVADATDAAGLTEFIQKNGFPLVDEINAKTFKRFAEAGIPLAVFFLSYENDSDNKPKYLKTLTAAAEKLQGKVNIGYSDADMFKEQLLQMGGEKDKLPQMAAMNIETRMNYPYKGELEVDAIVAWGEGLVDGSVKPYLKSQPIPEKNDGPVRIVVGETFDAEVIEAKQDVMVMFQAEWCGHCKSLKPKYEKVGEYFSDIPGVVIASMDATENDQTAVQIEGFPTLYLFTTDAEGKRQQIPYEGERTAKALKKFIYENASQTSKDQIKEKVSKKKAAKKEEL